MSDAEDTPEQLLQFPCSFPVKMMGRDDAGFRDVVVAIVERHAGSIADHAIRIAPSSTGKFVSVTITIDAESQQQLDNIYRELTEHEDVLVAL